MAFAHSLEVLYALLRLYASGTASSSSFSDVPYPHLQQRLQQTLRAVALTAFCTVLIPLLLLCLLPLLSPLEFPASLRFSTVAHLTLRYALLPTPRRAEAEPVRGGLQAAVCAIMDAVTRVREQPQLPCCFCFVWLILAGGLVAFVSFVLVEKSLAEDPFVLDPRAAFVRAMQRVWCVQYVAECLCTLWDARGAGCSLAAVKWGWATETAFFSLHSSRVMFQITTSFLENLAILSAASVFRILLFRASHQVVGGAFGETNNFVKPKEGDVVTALFATEAAANPQNTTPLNEQYLQVKKISDKKTPKAPADAEDVEILDSLFKFENLLTGCKFDAAARETLFTSWDRWNALFSSTTAVVDGFTKGDAGDCSPTGALALEQSVAALLRFLNSQHDAHPLLVLQQYPHLANLRISSSSVKSSIRFFVESKLQFAIRRFLMEEARRRVFQRAKVVRAAESLLCHLVSVSRAEDKQGYVQHTVPAVVSSLLECRNALDAYMETCLKESSTTDVYVQEATALAKGIDSGIYRITEVFQGELSLFAFPPGVKKALLAYASFDA
ncbi:Nucleoporin protein Ndc1-Nup [Phytophthora cactorum]|nr:Nucleoporin protein Ndc1-Nup [Phytophthora cactorum]